MAPVPITATFLPADLDRLVRPVIGVERAALEIVACRGCAAASAPTAGRSRARRSGAVSSRPSPILSRHRSRASSKCARLDLAVELHVLAQVELVGDVVEVAQVLRLAGKALLPVPLVEQFARERDSRRCSSRNRSGSRDSGSSTRCRRGRARSRARWRRSRDRPAA